MAPVNAFVGCDSLTRLFFEGNAPDVSPNAFTGATAAVLYYRPGTSGWAKTVAGRPTALWIPIYLGEAPASPLEPLKLRSTTPAPARLSVQRSANLQDWEDWRTVSRTVGPGTLTDPDSGALPFRFYRAVEIGEN